MNREDAFYYENLLVIGFSDEYDNWLNSLLETENPLSDITLDLAGCGSDKNKTISVLREYRSEQPVDEKNVCERLRLFLKTLYDSGKMEKGQVVSAMHTIASHVGAPDDFDVETWGDMFYFDDYYFCAKEDVLAWEVFDKAFFAYLNDGISLDSDSIWGNRVVEMNDPSKGKFIFGLKIDEPSLFIPWELTESELLDLLSGYEYKKIADHYYVSEAILFDKQFRGSLGFHFDQGGRLTTLELRYADSDYSDDEKVRCSFEKTQKILEGYLGRPSILASIRCFFRNIGKKDKEYIWNYKRIRIQHELFDRFGLEERLAIVIK